MPYLALGREHHAHNIQSEGWNSQVGSIPITPLTKSKPYNIKLKPYNQNLQIKFSFLVYREHFCESMDTMPGLAAFDRPTEDRNIRGFGFQVKI